MPGISVSRDGVIIGTYDLPAIKLGITSGSISLQDWAWYEGMTEWAPVAEIVNQLEVTPQSAPSLPPTPPQSSIPFTLSAADAEHIEKTQKITFRDRHLFKRPQQ